MHPAWAGQRPRGVGGDASTLRGRGSMHVAWEGQCHATWEGSATRCGRGGAPAGPHLGGYRRLALPG